MKSVNDNLLNQVAESYEQEKLRIQKEELSPTEYEQAIRKLCKRIKY
jgi:hypothetical protein